MSTISFTDKQQDASVKQPKIRVAMLGPTLAQNGGIATIEKLTLKYAPPDIEIQHITSHDEGSITHRLVVFVKSLVSLLWTLLQNKIDVLHLHLSERGSAVRKAIFSLIAFIFRKPVIIHANGAEFHTFFLGLPQWAKLGLRWIFSRTNFIVVSNSWKDFYAPTLGLDPKQVFVLANPVEVPSEAPKRINSTKVSLAFFGRVGQRKGTFDLIRAFANLPAEQKQRSELIVAGDGEVEAGRQLAESLNIADCVTFLGWVNPEQRDKILAKADVFALPSYNEGLPLALLEAMAWGLPVISTPIAGIPEVVTSGENGLLVNPGDIQQLSAAMQSLIEDENLRLSLGNAARETVARIDVKNYWASLTDIYCSVVQGHSS